jgi:hypothetical protein
VRRISERGDVVQCLKEDPSARMTRCGNCGTTGFGSRFGRRFQTCVRPYGDEETARVKGGWTWTWTVEDDEVVGAAPLRSAGTNDFAKMLGIIMVLGLGGFCCPSSVHTVVR